MKKPASILILDNTFTFGGAINSLRYLLQALDKEQFAPVLVTGQPREFLSAYFDCAWYHYIPKLPWVNNRIYRNIVSLRMFRSRPLLKALNLLRFLYWIIVFTLPEALRYYGLGRKHHVALVHLNNILGSQLAGILAAKLLGVPCVAHMRDFEEIHPVTRLYARLVDHHVAISEAVRDNLRQLGVPIERITVVHDALDPSKFRPSIGSGPLAREFGLVPGQLAFGIFGRVAAWKGIREFILASRKVIDEIPSAVGFVVGGPSTGDEDFFEAVQQFAAELGLERKVVFTGYRKDPGDLMDLMDIIVHASTRPEPFGMVIIEGMAMRKPVVATRGGGPLDIVNDRETGLLVQMGDSEDLGKAIITLLRQPDLRHKMGLAGRSRVERYFTSHRSAAEIANLYQRLGVPRCS
jgi:glycosyltransferase involved in cell wall biosynthesis